MMLSVMVVGAGAAFSDQSKIKNTEAVDMCTALNIIGGYPDGTFKPEGNITRAEVTKMICVALNGGKEPNVGTNATPTFSDVRTSPSAAWAEGYIESCYAQGIVSGVGGGKFAPNGNVTATQMAKMLLVALGYNADNEGFTGNAWATNVNVRASQKGLYEDLENIDVNAALTRDNAAQMIWNALNAYEVEYKTTLITDSKGQLTSQITVQDKLVQGTEGFVKITLLEDKYESYTYTGILTKIEWNDTDKEYEYTIGNDVTNKDQSVTKAPTFKSASDFSDLFGMNVKVVYNENKKTNDIKVFGIVPKDSKVLATAILDDIEYSDTNEIKVDGTKYKTDEDVLGAKALQAQAFNGSKVNLFKDKNNLNDSLAGYYSATVIDNDNDGKADLVVYLPVTVAKVTYSGTKSINAGASYTYEDHDIASGIEKDDYVVITAKANTTKDRANIVKAEIVSGEVTATKAGKIQIGSKWYTLAGGMKVSDYSVGDSYDVAVYNGFAFSSDATEEASKDILFISGAKAFDEYAGEKNGTVDAKVYFLDGSYKTVTITKVDGEKLKLAERQTAQQLSDSLTGKLYTYTVKDGNYELKTLNDSNNKAGYKNYADGATFAENKETIGGYAIADDAVIFVKDKEETKVMTGKTVKDWSANFGTSGEVLVSEINGIKYAKVAALINTSATKPDASGDLKYAYLVDDTYLGQTKDEDKDDALVFTVFGENGAATLYDTDDYGKTAYAVDNFKKGQLIEYKEDGKEIKDVKVVAESTLNTTNIQTVAITGIEDKNEGLVYFLDGKNAGGVSYKLDKDAYFVKIDDANTSAEAGKRSEVTNAQSETTGKKTVNAYIATETDSAGKTTIVAVYYDVDKLDEGTQYDENIVTLPAGTKAATIKKLADGVYIPTDTAFDTASNITMPIESNRIFKFNAPTEAAYTLTIKNDKDVVVYTETSSSLSEGAHFFFISTNASTEHPNTGADSTYGKAPFAKGDYTFTISGSSDVLSGSFTVA